MKKFFTAIFVTAFSLCIMAQTSVTFTANMSVLEKKGLFFSKEPVYVKGSMNGWSNSNPLTKSATDSTLFSTTISSGINAGDTIQFKFMYTHSGGDIWENDPNRTYIVKAGANNVTAYFNNDSIYTVSKNVIITWQCNMELELLSGRLKSTDTVSVNGSHNGWTSKKSILRPNPSNPNLYIGRDTVIVAQTDTIQYKYWYSANGGTWESIDNRKVGFSASEFAAGAKSVSGNFNNGSLDNVINQPCKIKFTVNCQNAKSSHSGTGFTEIKNVYMAGSSAPLQWPSSGWPNAEITKMLKMYDDGTHGDVKAGDKIFSLDTVFAAYTVLSVQYKYSINYGDSLDNGTNNDNENSFGVNHVLQMTTKMSGATTIDTFGVMKTSNLGNVTGVQIDQNPGLARTYQLSQNYPNPFNPTTTINFSVPEQGYVTLKVYDILGREVMNLLSGQKNAGNYSVMFDASKLGSGVYFYTLSAKNYLATKKMMLLK